MTLVLVLLVTVFVMYKMVQIAFRVATFPIRLVVRQELNERRNATARTSSRISDYV